MTTSLNQSHLSAQDLINLDITQLTPLSPEVISRQATINIGTIGHVAHGKSTVVKAISGVQTVRFKNELERNITIKLARLSSGLVKDLTTSRDKLRAFVKVREKQKEARLKSAIVVEVQDIRFRDTVIEVLVKWKDMKTPIWEDVAKIKDNLKFRGILNRIVKTNTCSVTKFCASFNTISTPIENPKYFIEKVLPHFDEVEFNCYMLLYEKIAKNGGLVGPNVLKEFKKWAFLAGCKQKRLDQLQKLDNLRNHIKEVGKVDIIFENNIDFEIPNDFKYVKECFSNLVQIPDDPIIGCVCRKCNEFSNCCGEMSGMSHMAYNKDKTLKFNPGKAIYECNSRCKCDSSCINRVVQEGISIQLSVFKTPDRGWGLKTLESLKSGQFVCEYAGEIIDQNEANKRGKKYDNIGLTYLFDLDYNSTENPCTVDAFSYGNASRFMNHSCTPNCGIWVTFVNCLDPNLPRLGIFTLRPIEAGEELTFDYNIGQGALDSSQGETNAKKTNRIGQCFCKSKKCRSFLFETVQD